jgi:hypothetical protein
MNEFSPAARASVAVDLDRIAMKSGVGIIREWTGDVLDDYVRGTLAWSVEALPVRAAVPETQNPLWLAPRRVDSRYVTVASGQTERYLFYRGVAHLEAMFRTRSSDSEFTLLAPRRLHWLPRTLSREPSLGAWICSTRARVPAQLLRKPSPDRRAPAQRGTRPPSMLIVVPVTKLDASLAR